MIDWEKEWELHAPFFKNGAVHLTDRVKLKPGPGFGDYSHPTTRLVARLMGPHAPGKRVIDAGCGSGVLSLLAKSLGACQVIGFDIDPEAVAHAKTNAQLNQFEINFYASEEIFSQVINGDLLLMNMIYTEQMQVFTAFPSLKDVSLLISSGVLVTQREEYLALARSWGFALVEQKEEEGWLGFVFQNSQEMK